MREYLSRIRSLQWQAMQVREEQLTPLAAPPGSLQEVAQQQQQQQQEGRKLGEGGNSSGRAGPGVTGVTNVTGVTGRGFEGGFQELPETGMSELGQMCRDAGFEGLFLSALKISR